MDSKLKELTGKFKALNFVVGKVDDAITAREKENLKRIEVSLTTKVNGIYTVKDEIEELKFINEESEEDVQTWADEIETKLRSAREKTGLVKQTILEIENEETLIQGQKDEEIREKTIKIETDKQIAIEKARLELEKAHKEEERKRELEHQDLILQQRLKFEKDLTTTEGKLKQVKNAKLPKLDITNFSGKVSDWLPFWNIFEAEIDATEMPAVSKFGYLKELLEPKVRAEIEGLPFNSEGYERAKNILKSEYGRTSEIINAHIQEILNLPVITGTSPTKVHEFYRILAHNVRSLQTLGKVERVNGNTRNVLEKLKGIKADLVRGQDNWQDWDLPQLVIALKRWRDINTTDNPPSDQNKPPPRRPGSRSNLYHTKDGERKKRDCVYCNETTHSSKDCTKVATTTERKKYLTDRKLCFNCTGVKHRAAECKSNTTCQICQEKHHTSICPKSKHHLLTTAEKHAPVVYPIVIVNVEGVKCRALLDTGAGNSYASAALLNLLAKRECRKETRRVEMMLGTVTREMELSTINVQSVESDFNINVDVTKVENHELLEVDNPNYPQLISDYQHLSGITINDNDKKSKLPIHLILGAGDYICIKTNQPARVGKTGEPVAERTEFGWTIIAKGSEIDYTALLLTQTNHSDYEKLCRLDVLGLEDRPEHDQQSVYAEFREQLVRSKEGWYETGLPWKGNHPNLPDHKEGSLRRLANLTRKLNKTELTGAYGEIINEQRNNGIIEEAPESPVGTEFYIPHKPVVRESAESTKLRIVYDASARAHPDAPSLNDCLHAGPALQNRLWDVLVRMRFHPVALAGDLKQAFLQVRIKEADRDALRFHWKPDELSELQTLRFTRALFGLTCSPFLLGGVIEHHLETWKERKPEVVSEIEKSMYVDDLISGEPTVSKAKQLKENAIEIFKDATFTLHKWHSNEPALEDSLKADSEDVTYAKQQFGAVNEGECSLLGLPWNKSADTISVVIPTEAAKTTKRGTLQKLAKIYDPLGLVSPITLQGKLIYREICLKKIGWDTELDEAMRNKLTRWEQNLPSYVTTKRSLVQHKEEIDSIELHAFGDASGEGVSSAVYAVVRQQSKVTQGLVAAKSRLAKQGLTIPRLELVSAHMAANLISNVERALEGFPVTVTQGWLDSTVALHWINGGGEYKQFVANRIQKIKSNTNIKWRHVPTDQNPADLGSRGGSVQNKKLWWDGPSWLSSQETWPEDITSVPTKESNAEAKIIKRVLAVSIKNTDEIDQILNKHDLWKTLRISAWIWRFAFNCRRTGLKLQGPLKTNEIERQKLLWVKRAQSGEINEAERLTLNLQRDERGVLVCRGRIQGSYPIFVPDTHSLALKIVEQAHLRTLHGGVGMTMSYVREEYWIPRLRRLARKIIKNCYGCRRFQAKALEQPTPGLLPRDRTEGSRPFQTIGVDFAGPMKFKKRNKTEGKAYIVLYACSLTRAIYIDLLNSLATAEFIRSLKGFIARKGRPEKIYSDNGKTFVAAAKWLGTVQKDENFQNTLATTRIHWQFNLSRAPWWGGQFERLIGLVKRAMEKTIGKGCLQWHELQEVLLDVEVAINNRPLSYIEEDIQMPILTPNTMMFVGSNEIPTLKAHHLEETDLRKRAKFISKCKDALWKRWTTEYLRSLRERHNQSKGTNNVKLDTGDVVIIKSEEKNRGKWQLGVVDKLHNGRDGIVRAVRLRAGKSFLERPPTHLYPLELSCDKKKERKKETLDPNAAPYRPKRDAAVAARQRIQEEANTNN